MGDVLSMHRGDLYFRDMFASEAATVNAAKF
jgi:hypothetical protein